MKNVVLVVIILVAGVSAFSQDSAKLDALEKKVQKLESRITQLETLVTPLLAKAEKEKIVHQQQIKARKRMQKDLQIYSRDQLREVEKLYQVANRKWRSQAGKDSLKELIGKFDKANRTGCAMLYLGQMSKGKEKEEYLQKAIDNFSDCYYGNGVQVGPYARYFLAYYYKKNGQDKKAEELFKEIKHKYPDAINHKGKLLIDMIREYQ